MGGPKTEHFVFVMTYPIRAALRSCDMFLKLPSTLNRIFRHTQPFMLCSPKWRVNAVKIG
ncbi:hypothetical protein LCM4573_11120 [Rhizobium sp. LCM 4573]|nr:hypothetical protein LCM4573_11120 [Rhizobium sp. LCM 4573]